MNVQELETITADALESLDCAGKMVGLEYEATSDGWLVFRCASGHAVLVGSVPMASDLVRVVLRSRHGRLLATTDVSVERRTYEMAIAVLAACFAGFATVPAVA